MRYLFSCSPCHLNTYLPSTTKKLGKGHDNLQSLSFFHGCRTNLAPLQSIRTARVDLTRASTATVSIHRSRRLQETKGTDRSQSPRPGARAATWRLGMLREHCPHGIREWISSTHPSTERDLIYVSQRRSRIFHRGSICYQRTRSSERTPDSGLITFVTPTSKFICASILMISAGEPPHHPSVLPLPPSARAVGPSLARQRPTRTDLDSRVRSR